MCKNITYPKADSKKQLWYVTAMFLYKISIKDPSSYMYIVLQYNIHPYKWIWFKTNCFSFNVNTTNHNFFLLLTKPWGWTVAVAALLRRLDTQNKVGVSCLVSVKVKIKAATSFVQEWVAMCRFLQAVDWISLFRIVGKMDMTVDFVTDSYRLNDEVKRLPYKPGSSKPALYHC